MTFTPEREREIEARCAAATAGPWESIIDDSGGPKSGWPLCVSAPEHLDRSVVRTGGLWPYEWDTGTSQRQAVDDAAFIAHARKDVEDLLSSYKERGEVIRLCLEALDASRGDGDFPDFEAWEKRARAALQSKGDGA